MGGDSPVVQWLKLHAANAGGAGSIPGPGAKNPTGYTVLSNH